MNNPDGDHGAVTEPAGEALTPPGPPPAPPTRGRPVDPEKQRAIMKAATHQFLETGYEGTSMDAIAQRAGVSKQTVYRHFGTKEALLRLCITAKMAEFMPEPESLIQSGHDLRSTLVEVGDGFVRLLISEEALSLHRLVTEEVSRGSVLPQVFYDEGPQRMHDMLAAFLARQAAAGRLSVSAPHLAAEQLICMFKGLDHMACTIGVDQAQTPESRAARVRSAVDLFLAGYAPDPAQAT